MTISTNALNDLYNSHLASNDGNFNSDAFTDISLRKKMIALHIASNPKLKASLDKQNVSYDGQANNSNDKLLEANYELVQIARGKVEQTVDFVNTVDAGIKRIITTGDYLGKELLSDDISYSRDRLTRALDNISWIKKYLPAILVERVFKEIESYEKRAINILESLKSK
jgi:guanyl-specific ribonuclease Sa